MYEPFPYIYRGSVVDNDDPKNTGRCKINIPSIYGSAPITKEMLPWARIMTTYSYTDKRASICIPDIGDIVWVFFEGGDKNFPVYIGGSVGIHDIPVDIDEVVFYKEEDNSLIYNRKTREYSIIIEEHKLILKKDENMRILSTLGIDIESDDTISIKGENLSLRANKSIDLNAQNISLRGETLNIDSGSVNISGLLTLNGDITVTGTLNVLTGITINGAPVLPG